MHLGYDLAGLVPGLFELGEARLQRAMECLTASFEGKIDSIDADILNGKQRRSVDDERKCDDRTREQDSGLHQTWVGDTTRLGGRNFCAYQRSH
ncbi:MAG: hypothetical protein B9S38_01265 [Verrucomicrobiia bacterium Tous-C4TDCM]|nr:MAG: hypothetical protein B9S38_01265 [Verrucomicrobiae bacterium Tous-C4TDCM]